MEMNREGGKEMKEGKKEERIKEEKGRNERHTIFVMYLLAFSFYIVGAVYFSKFFKVF